MSVVYSPPSMVKSLSRIVEGSDTHSANIESPRARFPPFFIYSSKRHRIDLAITHFMNLCAFDLEANLHR